MKITWIGTGIMGSHMALHLANNNYDVTAYNRTIEKANKLKPKVKVKNNIKEAVFNADVIFTMLGYPNDVKTVIKEVFKHAKKGAIIIDMTTSDPNLAISLFNEGLKQGFDLLDAPVTGSDTYAKAGTLSIMVGGKEEIFQKVLPLLEAFGKTITYVGKSGNGQLAKLSNQIAIAGTLSGVVESLYFASKNNLDLKLVHQILSGGSAYSNQLSINGLKIIEKDLKPGFYVKHFLKDLNLAISINKDLLILNQVKDMIQSLVDNGHENLGTQSLILYYLDSLIKNN
ncbi:MAG: NAD(P)-dependent oxidoreductase [Acholeplasmataceae bacterium]